MGTSDGAGLAYRCADRPTVVDGKDSKEGLIDLLTECGVGSPKREELLENYPDRIRHYCDAYSAKREASKYIGPGFLIRAIENGWELRNEEAEVILPHKKACDVVSALGGEGGKTMDDIFEAVDTSGGLGWKPKPEWLGKVRQVLLNRKRR